MNSANVYTSIDDYIVAQPVEVIPLLNRMRNIIRKAAPHATEVISYGMPAYKLHKVLVYVAAVITSYSIHYTKLYEATMPDVEFRQ